MELNDAGIKLIQSFEGLKLEPYNDGAGYMTIGFGHRIKSDEHFGRISMSEAYALLKHDILFTEDGVRKLVNIRLTDNQFSSLVSFAFNCGLSNLKKSTLLKLVNAGVVGSRITAAFLMWTKAGGKQMSGLVKRRTAEANLFNGVV